MRSNRPSIDVGGDQRARGRAVGEAHAISDGEGLAPRARAVIEHPHLGFRANQQAEDLRTFVLDFDKAFAKCGGAGDVGVRFKAQPQWRQGRHISRDAALGEGLFRLIARHSAERDAQVHRRGLIQRHHFRHEGSGIYGLEPVGQPFGQFDLHVARHGGVIELLTGEDFDLQLLALTQRLGAVGRAVEVGRCVATFQNDGG